MTGKEFNEKLHQGKKLFGTCITQPAPLWTKIAGEIKLDFVFIDNEHQPFNPTDIANLCQIYSNMGIVPIVRIPCPDPVLASKTLDSGALGIVAPYVETVDQIQDLIGAVKYAPLKGNVLRDGLRKDLWHPDTKALLEDQNAHRIAIINIESVPALENLSQLASVPGLDAMLIGPHDLTINMGIPIQYEHPLFLKAVEKIIKTARSNDLGAGIHAWWSLEQEKSWLNMGLNLLIHASEYMAARIKLSDDFKVLREDDKSEIKKEM